VAESVALSKFACPACGGEAHWNPLRQTLVCVSCGTALAVELPKGSPAPHPLEPALQRVAPAAADSPERVAVRCRSCNAVSWFDRGTAADRCSFCGSAAILPLDAGDAADRPDALLPFSIGEDAARELALGWYRKQWLAPNTFRRRAMTDTVKAAYLPFFSFDADASAAWEAGGGSGAVEQACRRILVCAMDAPPPRVRAIEPCPAGEWPPYAPAFAAGWAVAPFQMPLAAAVPMAQQRMEEALLKRARDAEPDGNKRKKMRLTGVRYANQAYLRALLPVWRLTYTYFGRPYELVINGATGSAAGDAPTSLIKIALVLALFGWIYVFVNDPEFAVKLPFWLAKGLWLLLARPFGGG
jgi:hypothetical protein